MELHQAHASQPRGLRLIFRSLHYRNYRLFFGGQGISLIGTWMQRTAVGWLVYRLTSSPFLLGLVEFAGYIPTLFLSPLAGVLADRWDRRRILLFTQVLAMIQALLLAFLVLGEQVEVWHILCLSLFLGVVSAFDIPARQSLVVSLIERREDLGNAIALNSFMFNGARLVGPSAAGFMIALLGEGLCFLINGLSFLAVIASLMAMRLARHESTSANGQLFQGFREGLVYAYRFPPMRLILMLVALGSLMGIPFWVLLPVFAKDILHGGPQTLGFLMAAAGAGALCGAVYLASRRSVLGLARVIALAAGIFGTGLMAFSFARALWLSLLLLVITGFGMIALMASSNTFLQTIVDDDKRGRVMSFFTMALMGMAPFGSLLAGILASKIGAPHTLLIGGLSCLLGAVLFGLRFPRASQASASDGE
jgi:MFS family permease